MNRALHTKIDTHSIPVRFSTVGQHYLTFDLSVYRDVDCKRNSTPRLRGLSTSTLVLPQNVGHQYRED